MNKKTILLFLSTSLLLTGCGLIPVSTSTSKDVPLTTDPTISTSISSESETSVSPSSSGKDLEHLEINLTAINDFHGYIEEDQSKGYVGLATLSTYLKDRKTKGSILINSGDSYQGTFLSNYDKGKLISETFNEIGFDAYTIGNHEFDWGISSIKQNESWQGQRYLGANIYSYPKQGDYWVKSDLGDKYRIVTVNKNTDAEVKVGIIGVIGKDQITSIESQKVEDYIFLDPTEIIKSTSLELRAAGCDIVVADYHSGEFDYSITSSVDGKKYVDAIFLAHTHKCESSLINNVPIIQAGEYGEAVAEVSLIFNKKTNTVVGNQAAVKYLTGLEIDKDLDVKAKIDAIKTEADPIGQSIVGRNEAGYISSYNMSRFYAKLAADKASELGLNVDYVLFNSSREPLKKTDITCSDLFLTHPFMNKLYILSCTEKNISNEISFDQIGYNVCGITPSKSSARKDVLVFSYNGFHQAVNSKYEKYYNYFDTGFDSGALHPPIELEGINVFDLAIDWLKTNSITTSDFSGSMFI